VRFKTVRSTGRGATSARIRGKQVVQVVQVEGVRPGERAVVHATRTAGQLEATDVKLGSAKK